jgi:hypothetical protein
MRPTLNDIEKAVRSNFVMNPDSSKFLETDDRIERDNKSAARIVFVGVACEYGLRYKEVCAHSDMTITEYNALLRRFRIHLAQGREKDIHRDKEKHYNQAESIDSDLRIYRKYILVRNCIEILKRKRLVFF